MAKENVNHNYTITKADLIKAFKFKGEVTTITVYTPRDRKSGYDLYDQQTITVGTTEKVEV